MKDQGIFTWVIVLINSHNLSVDNVWILLGENWCWSLLGLKGLTIMMIVMILIIAMLNDNFACQARANQSW